MVGYYGSNFNEGFCSGNLVKFLHTMTLAMVDEDKC